MRELVIAKICLDPSEVYDDSYADVFQHMDRVSVINTFIRESKTFLAVMEIELRKGSSMKTLKETLANMDQDRGNTTLAMYQDITELASEGDRCLCLVKGEHMQFHTDMMDSLTDQFCFLELPVVYTEGGIHMQVVGKRDDVKAYLNILEGLGVSHKTEFIREYHPGGRAVLAELTDKQYQCMKTAMDQGYFDIPRRTDLRDMAEKDGITHGALSFHLRKAQRTIFDVLFS
ncbi:MAG: helix-turn-helix domain-containing protein [Thermoplasmata archaeon]|nr:helix-turn-helix domain-containing protein [Thermoplasmata archaeon]